MTEAQHTTGPWELNGLTPDGHYNVRAFNAEYQPTVALIHFADRGIRREANARLIAAAHELLEALSNLQASILIHCPTNAALVVEKEIRAARSALAKATGQAA